MLKHEPKHRAPSSRRAPRAALRSSLTLSAMAVVGTGLAVSGGALVGLGDSADGPEELAPAAGDLAAATGDDSAAGGATDTTGATDATSGGIDTAALEASRDDLVTRSDRRDAADPAKADLLEVGGATVNAMTRTEDLSDEDPRTIARALLAEFGFSEDQFGCLDSLWTRESNWSVTADNPSSSAYGIPQALPGSKMSSAGADWATNPVTQIRWGLGYIEDRYGSPCSAWGHSQSRGWY
ncbi:lytic transglycosylase domain-containing protein [Nocardioides sp.]|uniref:aggregation-promoting factor C-terminal-like domain-containing protein n=1 Tax=Nocardioides sp. TaxID=35761 RepID=UPI001A19E4D0|nr:lytic transglycosylase domain-containing protein [Nocardioides sp.]MBJ7356535.1 lytic transglycosylase domain-containing protein [Nocardioides sp.]